MPDDLEQAFHRYIYAVQSKLQKRSEEVRTKGTLRLHVNEAMELRTLVDELENEAEFHQLVAETRSSCSGDYHGKNESAWQQAVKNFFRRSEYYSDLFKNKPPSADTALQNYCEALQKREIRITYLAPMEFVQFAEQSMDFGAFQIRRFSANELRGIFRNKVNEVFYPWADIDVEQLKDYWFVYLTELAPTPKLGWVYLPFDLSQLDRVSIEYTRYPKAIESTLQHLTLFDWQADWWKGLSTDKEEELEKGWRGFRIPFVLMIDDNLLDSPRAAPDLLRLSKEPFVDALTGEEIGESPMIYIHLKNDGTDSFKAFIQHTGNLLENLRAMENERPFLKIPLGYFVKAFFTKGLEQLLWHITVLEALLGEKGKGVTKRLARRVAYILGKDEDERKAIREQFEELYDFRCNLVHGNPFQEQTYVGHLRNARNLARRILLWFLHYLNEIQAGPSKESIPTREEILKPLDLEQNSKVRALARLIDNLPVGFPYVREWLE